MINILRILYENGVLSQQATCANLTQETALQQLVVIELARGSHILDIEIDEQSNQLEIYVEGVRHASTFSGSIEEMSPLTIFIAYHTKAEERFGSIIEEHSISTLRAYEQKRPTQKKEHVQAIKRIMRGHAQTLVAILLSSGIDTCLGIKEGLDSLQRENIQGLFKRIKIAQGEKQESQRILSPWQKRA